MIPVEITTQPFASEDQAAYYLAALVDGEGYVTSRAARSVSVTNTEWSLIVAACAALTRLEIGHRVYAITPPKNPRWSVAWVVRISRKAELRRFASVVPLQSEAKRERLRSMLASYQQTAWVPEPEDLRRLYWDDLMPVQRIADRYKTSKGKIDFWLMKYGIPKRSRSASAMNRWRGLKQAHSA